MNQSEIKENCPECRGVLPWCKLIDRIQNYLGNGGLFNPEMMEHDKVRDLLIELRDALTPLNEAFQPESRSKPNPPTTGATTGQNAPTPAMQKRIHEETYLANDPARWVPDFEYVSAKFATELGDQLTAAHAQIDLLKAEVEKLSTDQCGVVAEASRQVHVSDQLCRSLMSDRSRLQARVTELEKSANEKDEYDRASISVADQLRAERDALKGEKDALDWLEANPNGPTPFYEEDSEGNKTGRLCWELHSVDEVFPSLRAAIIAARTPHAT